jgi:hypothetical protein
MLFTICNAIFKWIFAGRCRLRYACHQDGLFIYFCRGVESRFISGAGAHLRVPFGVLQAETRHSWAPGHLAWRFAVEMAFTCDRAFTPNILGQDPDLPAVFGQLPLAPFLVHIADNVFYTRMVSLSSTCLFCNHPVPSAAPSSARPLPGETRCSRSLGRTTRRSHPVYASLGLSIRRRRLGWQNR